MRTILDKNSKLGNKMSYSITKLYWVLLSHNYVRIKLIPCLFSKDYEKMGKANINY